MRRTADRVCCLYVYKLTTDNGGAPCIYKDLLSLAICKPGIRRTAREGDWMFGFGGSNLRGRGRLIYIAQVTKRLPNGSYYVNDAYKGRPDRIYRREGATFVWRKGAKYHKHGTELEHDLGQPPGYSSAVTLLSNCFRYWGENGTSDYREQFRAVAALLDRLGRGHRVNLSRTERQQLRELQESEWQAHPHAMALGRPSQRDRRRVCNRSEGGVASARRET